LRTVLRPLLLALLLLGLESSVLAATRGFTVTSFDRIRVAGPFTVDLRTGPGSSARAEGPARGLDRLRVEVQGGTLIISADRTGSVGWTSGEGSELGQVVVTVTTPGLAAASLTGSGVLAIDRIKAASFSLTLNGSGEVAVGTIEADKLMLAVTGTGQARIAGKAAQARIVLQGSADIDGSKLVVVDADVTVAGSGDLAIAATRTAKVTADGAGDVTVLGNPACTVRATGAGEVRCGR
jgi:hypothetical protein